MFLWFLLEILVPFFTLLLFWITKYDENYHQTKTKNKNKNKNEKNSLILFVGQARLDGAFCDYSEEDKLGFLKRAYERGVRNIEMESLCFAAMTHRAGVKSKC